MSIQWFPGHMTSARKKAAESMERIDVVIEVLDARLPEASSNPMIRELRVHRQRACLKILNKADLADPVVTARWLAYYNAQKGVTAVAMSCKKPGDIRGRRRPLQEAARGRRLRVTESGLVIVDKPSGWTSHDVVGRMRRLAGTRKVGHSGTLDPMATGVLVLGLNRATRLLGHLTLVDKEYVATTAITTIRTAFLYKFFSSKMR